MTQNGDVNQTGDKQSKVQTRVYAAELYMWEHATSTETVSYLDCTLNPGPSSRLIGWTGNSSKNRTSKRQKFNDIEHVKTTQNDETYATVAISKTRHARR